MQIINLNNNVLIIGHVLEDLKENTCKIVVFKTGIINIEKDSN